MNVSALSSGTPRRIALIAHDNKKDDLLEWAAYNVETLMRHRLVATGTTGSLLHDRLELAVERVESGPMGGDLQIGALLSEGRVDAVIFLRDPMTPQPHEPDINALVRACDVHDVPCATNRASARILLQSLRDGNAAVPEG